METLLEVCLLASVIGVYGIQLLPADLAEEVAALQRNDFVAYSALHGMNLTYFEAVTPDGWVLELWRVRSPDIYDANLSAPVIVCHGFGSSSFDYMWNLRNQSTAFVLADNGYDVWLPNFRANQFSNAIRSNGTTRLPKPEEYYRGAWQYMAELDLPTIIDKVLEETGQSKFYLIGHSMGTTIPFASLSENHSYDDKLLHYAAVVPILKFGDETSFLIQTSLRSAPPIVRLLLQPVFRLVFGVQLLASSTDPEKDLPSTNHLPPCSLVPLLCELLANFVSVVTVLVDDPHLNQTRGLVRAGKTPAGVTMMNFYDYAQEWGKDPWTKIDFDKIPQTGFSNIEEYGSAQVPNYNFSEINVPYSLYFVKNDIFTGPRTAREIIAELHATDYKFIDGNGLSHVDAVIGFDTRCYTTNDIMTTFEGLENTRSNDRKTYRSRVKTFVNNLPFENGCPNPSD